MTEKPNLLFIFPDQHGAEYLGCYGHPDVKTPNLDRLASDSVLFENAFTAFPLCTPYRAALLTGRYCSQNGIMENNLRYPDTERSIADMFNEAGYGTHYIGKWHLAGKPHACRWVKPDERAGFKNFIGWECHHGNHIDKKIFFDDCPEDGVLMEGHETDRLTDITIKELEKLDKDKPFAMFVAYQAPHPVCEPPAEFDEMYRNCDLQLKPTVSHDIFYKGYAQLGAAVNQSTDEFIRTYYGEISQLDAAVGRIMQVLDETGLADNTVVVYTSDHGEMAGTHGRFEKNNMYEESIHVPLLVRMPGGKGKRTDALFSTVDFMTTFESLFGLDPKENAEGVDYSSLLTGQQQKERDYMFSETRGLFGIRDREYKLVTDRDLNITDFYSLKADPYEQDNLKDNASQSERIGAMLTRLTEWVKHIEGKE